MSIISRRLLDFVSLGKLNKDAGVRPEVKVIIASVYIDNINKKGNNLLDISAHADGAKYGYGGFISEDEIVAKLLLEAHEKNEPVCVRFEKKRKTKVDPTLPIEEISKTMESAKDNIVRIVSGIYDFNNNRWILTQEAQSSPEEDPTQLENMIKDLNYDTKSFFNNKTDEQQTYAPPINKELENCENALMSMYVYILENERKLDFELSEEIRKHRAIQLLKMANFLQTNMFGLDVPSYSAYSHTRARFLIFKWGEAFVPLTKEILESNDEFNAWGKTLLSQGTKLWQWTKKESASMQKKKE